MTCIGSILGYRSYAGWPCGKMIFIKSFLQHLPLMSDIGFKRVLFYYGVTRSRQLQYDSRVKADKKQSWGRDSCKATIKKNIIKFHKSLSGRLLNDSFSPKLIIISDLMRESSSSDAIVDLFTKGSHHNNLIVIVISQNLFHQSREQRDISLNVNYIVVFKNPRDRVQIRHLARQVFQWSKIPRRGILRRLMI